MHRAVPRSSAFCLFLQGIVTYSFSVHLDDLPIRFSRIPKYTTNLETILPLEANLTCEFDILLGNPEISDLVIDLFIKKKSFVVFILALI